MSVSSFLHESAIDDLGLYTNPPVFASSGRRSFFVSKGFFGTDDPSSQYSNEWRNEHPGAVSHPWPGAAGPRGRQGTRPLQTGPPWSLDPQRAGQGPFRLVLQALFVAAHDNYPHQDEEHRQHQQHDAHWPHQPMDVIAKQVAPSP